MQEAGVPVTYAYISDAHDNHTLARASGPGEADYQSQLQSYDQAFGAFFDRLKAHGIDKRNTLFVFTVDENDHFAGGDSSDGTWSHTFCDISAGQPCPANQIGEVNANLAALLPGGEPSFQVHSDSAPTVYVNGNPSRTDAALRKLERDVAATKAVDPYISAAPTPITRFLVDPVAEQTLHMVNADPRRTPTFTLFANPDYFLSTFNCPAAGGGGPICIDYHFAWSHGDATDDIGRIWLGLVGPGVRKLGQTSRIWADHTDVRPTMLALLGLKDSYEQDGRVMTQALRGDAVPAGLRRHQGSLTVLGAVYKQITAPFGEFGHDTLVASTRALAGGSATDDSAYTATEARIAALTQRRDALAAQIRTLLHDAAFGRGWGDRIDERQVRRLILQGVVLLADGRGLAAHG
jgi:arylsulfatase A-like enzyme